MQIKPRLLEEPRNLKRAGVLSAEVLAVEPHSVLLRTLSKTAIYRALSSSDPAMTEQQKRTPVGEEIEGRLVIDVVSDAVLRIRYQEGQEALVHETPLVVGAPAAPTACSITVDQHALEGVDPAAWQKVGPAPDPPAAVIIRTPRMEVIIGLSPYQIQIRNPQGEKICGIGGREKNAFWRWDSLNTGIARVLADGSPLAVENFDLRHDECIYGLGEKFIQLDKVGQTVDLDMFDAVGVTTPRSYKNVPLYISTAGYGVFFNHLSAMTYWVGSRSAADIQVAAHDDFLDYYVMVGDIKQVLSAYTDITGKGVLPPKWSFGFWQSKFSYRSAAETLHIARRMREQQFPCDVIHLDTDWFKSDWYCDLTFDPVDFPDPAGLIEELAGMGYKVSLWQLPYLPQGSQLFEDVKAVDGFVKTADGEIYDSGLCYTEGFKGIVAVIDYTNPEAVRVHKAALRRLFRLGAKVIKTDFGESTPVEGVYHDGTPGRWMHNLYPLLYNQAVFEVTKEETGDGVVWARSAWAGGQRYPLHWGGDSTPNYMNMAPQMAGGLSLGLSGFQFWSQDIGGFLGNVSDHLLIRWMQVGMFISHSRIHGAGDRELFRFSPEVQRICGDYLRLRYRLMPYIYGEARRCVETSLPMARALVVEYQDDPNTWHIADEHLLGDSLLVAPIYSEENHRLVYLPEGVWTDWWSGERVAGSCWIEVTAELDTMPLYIREGGIIPLGPVMQYTDEFLVDEITLRVSLFSGNGQTSILVPVNDEWIPVAYTADARAHTIKIGKSGVMFTGEYFGMDSRPVEVVSAG